MDSGNGNLTSRADRLGEILGAYFVAVEQGRAPSRHDLLAQHPDLAGELAEFFAQQDRLDRMVAPMRSPGSPASTAIDDVTASFASFPQLLLRDTDPGSDGDPLIQPLSPEMPALADRPARLQLFGEIARGGMGAILRGRDVDLGRELAVKVLLESNQGHPEVVRRFIEEAQIGGQLQHPGIVPVYELGAFADRRPYFAMKLVKGQTLAALLAERTTTLLPPGEGARRADEGADDEGTDEDPAVAGERKPSPRPSPGGRGGLFDLPRFLSIFEQVCQTVAYAHARGVIHRDLKPSNVMVGAFGEVQVMDWGLAKVLPRGDAADRTPQDFHETDVMTVRSGSGTDASRAGSILGTPSYMAPEQARGELDQVDERADVFGLGAILCEILTGKPPFGGETRDKVRENAAQGALAGTLHRLDTSDADSELISLARDCLAADRQQRPRDARIVSSRITAYLSGVQDRLRKAELARVKAQARAEEEQKRRRITVALAGSVLLTAGVIGGGWSYLARQQQRRAAQVDLALREAELRRDDAELSGDDLTRWIAAREAAQAAVRLVADARDAATRDRVTALLQQVDQAAKTAQDEQKLLAKLVDIRSAYADDPDGSASDHAFADAFLEAGIDVDSLPQGEAGVNIKARPMSVALALAGP
jgi:serine/threonine-protein kinase